MFGRECELKHKYCEHLILFKGYNYIVSPDKMSMQDAKDYCQSISGSLAVEGMQDITKRR